MGTVKINFEFYQGMKNWPEFLSRSGTDPCWKIYKLQYTPNWMFRRLSVSNSVKSLKTSEVGLKLLRLRVDSDHLRRLIKRVVRVWLWVADGASIIESRIEVSRCAPGERVSRDIIRMTKPQITKSLPNHSYQGKCREATIRILPKWPIFRLIFDQYTPLITLNLI